MGTIEIGFLKSLKFEKSFKMLENKVILAEWRALVPENRSRKSMHSTLRRLAKSFGNRLKSFGKIEKQKSIKSRTIQREEDTNQRHSVDGVVGYSSKLRRSFSH